MKSLLLGVCVLALTGCEAPARLAGLAGPTPVTKSLSTIIGVWTGDAPASQGEGGPITAIFDTALDPLVSLSARLLFWSNSMQATYRGTASGTLGNFTIQADQENPPGGTRCSYHANASLNAAEDTITGSYSGTGGGVCATKAGSFTLKRQGPPPCVGHDLFTFPAQEWVAHFPVGFANPWYPSERGPYSISIPAGTWALSAVTGDTHSEKPEELTACLADPLKCQKGEQVRFAFPDGQQTSATIDVPENADIQTSPLGTMTFGAPVSSVRVLHAGPLPVSEPTDSVYAVSLSYACPVR